MSKKDEYTVEMTEDSILLEAELNDDEELNVEEEAKRIEENRIDPAVPQDD